MDKTGWKQGRGRRDWELIFGCMPLNVQAQISDHADILRDKVSGGRSHPFSESSAKEAVTALVWYLLRYKAFR